MLSIYDISEANFINILMIKESIILLGKSRDTKFNITDYKCLI